MRPDDKRYQLGSFISARGLEIAQVTSLSDSQVGVLFKDGREEVLPWHQIYPVNLDVSFMEALGFKILKKDQFVHHLEYVMDIRVNGRFYSAKGIILADRSIWSFNNTSVRYMHQIQAIMWIIEPYHSFKF
jgi:hypothetical protein